MNKLPKSRNENIVMQDLSDEVLIYDSKIDKAYNLNETASVVFRACDGATTFDELRAKSTLTDEIIYLTLDGLQQKNLLDENAGYVSPFAGVNRREIIRKIGLASMITLPVISSLISPTASVAASRQRFQGELCSPANNTQGNCRPGLICLTTTGTCQNDINACQCVVPADCAVQVGCPSNVNCNPQKICAP